MPWEQWDPNKETYVSYLERMHALNPQEPYQEGSEPAPGYDIFGMPLPDTGGGGGGGGTPTDTGGGGGGGGGGTPPPDLTTEQNDAFEYLKTLLGQWELTSQEVIDLARKAAVGDWDENMFVQMVEQTTTFKQAFPEMEIRRQNGYDPMTAGEIITWRSTMKTIMQRAGLPADFYNSNDDYAKFIGQNISPDEVKWRVEQGYTAMMNAPQQVRDALFEYYNVTPGQLAAWFLDEKRAQPILEKEAAAAQFGGIARTSGFGGLTREEAEQFYGAGVSTGQAEQQLGLLGTERELFGALPGEEGMTDLSRAEQLSTVTAPTGAAQQELEKRKQKRKAVFGGGGEMAQTAQGVIGLADLT